MANGSDFRGDYQEFNLDDAIRKIPDFPKPGILFYDITSILANPRAFKYCIDSMFKLYGDTEFDAAAAIESRGFVFAAPFCYERNIPLLLVRKKGKLPGRTISCAYELEYGTAVLEMHIEDIKPKARFLVIDDLIATGGTINATCEMIKRGGAVPVRAFSVIGLPSLKYQEKVTDVGIDTLIEYSGE